MPRGQHPGDASSSFGTWVPAAQPTGRTGCGFPHQQHKLPEPRWMWSRDVGALAGNATTARVQLLPGQAQALSEHCSFRSPLHPIPTHPRAQSVQKVGTKHLTWPDLTKAEP